jgi:hypothetical protein
MKHRITLTKTIAVLLGTFMLWGSGCDIYDIKDRPDPNNTELSAVLDNPTQSNLRILVNGTLNGLRTDINLYFVDVGMVGREMYRFLAAEPRFTGDLLGKENAQLDAGSFYTTRPWAAYYTNIRMTNILIESAPIALDEGNITQAEANGLLGFAQTLQAYQYLMALTMTNENGIRQQLQSDIFNAGPPLNTSAAYDFIETLLDDAADNLDNAGSDFFFSLSGGFGFTPSEPVGPGGFDSFDTPATFREFNRALRARVAAYQADWAGVSSALAESFIDVNQNLYSGVYHVFTTNPNDLTNPMFGDPDAGAGDSWVAHPSWVTDAEAGDNRIARKVFNRTTTASLDDLSSDYGLTVYPTQTSPVPMIRNAELLLLRAEANINGTPQDLAAAESDINVIRSAAGLPPYSGATTAAALTDEMLNQRRYELFFEGHRWIDMRRYDRLDELPIDRAGDNVWVNFPIPENENL